MQETDELLLRLIRHGVEFVVVGARSPEGSGSRCRARGGPRTIARPDFDVKSVYPVEQGEADELERVGERMRG